MRTARLFFVIVVLAALALTPALAQTRERPAQVPEAEQAPDAGLVDAQAMIAREDAEFAQLERDQLQAMANEVVEATAAPHPAADVTAGTFGANTGGGNYAFTGRVGVGITSPTDAMHVVNGVMTFETNLDTQGARGFKYQKSRGTNAAKTIVQNNDSTGFFTFYGWDGTEYYANAMIRSFVDGATGVGDVPGRLSFFTTNGAGSLIERLRIDSGGDIDFTGDVSVTGTVTGGNIQAHYQDIAEWVPASIDLAPGDVVVLNPEAVNEVMPSSSAYDTRVAGVVSEQPGLTLGVAGSEKEMIATTGRVKVRVDATAAPIRVGDLLVTSDKAGFAMKSIPMEFNGRKLHQPGTIIGKALENLEDGEGTILVLLSMQ